MPREEHRRKETLTIGENCLFEVGCRTLHLPCYPVRSEKQRTGVEAASIGPQCTFEPKSRVPSSIALAEWCTVGAGCTLLPGPSLADFELDEKTIDEAEVETLPERTVVYGSDCTRRTWSGEGSGQTRALHAKHLAYLREMLPKYNKCVRPALKTFAFA